MWIYGAYNRRMSLWSFQTKKRKAFENQYLEISMGECIYKCWGFKRKEGTKSKSRGVEALTGEPI
jgi:hypothetical protein